jgi:hypothetical protein
LRRLVRIFIVSLTVLLLSASLAMAETSWCWVNECRGTDEDDTIHGGKRSQTVYVYDGDDTVHARGGGDTVYGAEASDTIYGELGPA